MQVFIMGINERDGIGILLCHEMMEYPAQF